jgi:hypothetical protein
MIRGFQQKCADNTFQHSCGLSFTGLKMMVDKDAERENDGEAMMSHWRINMNPVGHHGFPVIFPLCIFIHHHF